MKHFVVVSVHYSWAAEEKWRTASSVGWLLLCTAHLSTHAMYCCYCWLYLCTPCCPLHNNSTLLYLLTALVYRVSYRFLQGLGNIAQENIAANVLEDLLQPSLDMITVDQERELHKLNSKREAFVVLWISRQPKRCGLKYIPFCCCCCCFTGSWNGVVVHYWNVWIVLD